MSLSNAEIALIVDEIRPLAGRSVVQKIYEANRSCRILRLREPGHTRRLLLSTEPGLTRVHFVKDRPAQPATPSAFTMQLRRWLEGALFERIEQVNEDRIVRLHLRAVDPAWLADQQAIAEQRTAQQDEQNQRHTQARSGEPAGGQSNKITDKIAEKEKTQDAHAPRVWVSLVVELTGRHPNWYLLDADGRILGQLERESLGDRELAPGMRWNAPVLFSKHSSSLKKTSFSKIRWELDGADPERFERSQRVESFYADRARRQAFERLSGELRAQLKRRFKKLDRRVGHIEGDLRRVEASGEFRRRGELLQSAWGKVERGAASVRVPDFYDEALGEVEIPLNPALNLQENIEYYFHEYQRLKAAQDQIETRLLESMDRRDRVGEALAELNELDELDKVDKTAQADEAEPSRSSEGSDKSGAGDSAALTALKELAERLKAEGVLSAPRRRRRRGQTRAARKPYREFKSFHGTTILVGRGAADNDTLSISIARGRDYWFHARDWPGSHVVLRMPKNVEAPKNEDLLDAATLAGWFSQGKRDTLIDITYTRAKYVRKPKGFGPGRVTIADASTLPLKIESARLERLFQGEIRD